MVPPFISFITFNRLGLTVKNLPAILRSSENFDLHITDCNSKDNTWDYIMSLDDPRIKTKEHMDVNHGKTYALNMHLLRRAPEQYFFTVADEVLMESDNWIDSFMQVFKAFPKTGLLGAADPNGSLPPVILKTSGAITYLELIDASPEAGHYVPDHCMCLSPELIRRIGYFSEENCFGPVELSYRVCSHTDFKAGFVPHIKIQRPQTVSCAECSYSGSCKLDKVSNTCFTRYDKAVHTDDFMKKYRWKFDETVRDMQSGARTVYCASLLDGASVREHLYNMDWALDNFWYFIENAN
jgi:hypothetical protein